LNLSAEISGGTSAFFAALAPQGFNYQLLKALLAASSSQIFGIMAIQSDHLNLSDFTGALFRIRDQRAGRSPHPAAMHSTQDCWLHGRDFSMADQVERTSHPRQILAHTPARHPTRSYGVMLPAKMTIK